MNIVLILLISINGINCIEDGMSIDSLPAYSNSIVTITEYHSEDENQCSGIIISPRHIVATGLCVDGDLWGAIQVTARGTDPGVMMSVMVDQIYRYHDLRTIEDPWRPDEQLWLNNIVILHLRFELPRSLNYEPMPLNYQTWNHDTFRECYIVGYKVISPTMMIPQWTTVIVAPNSCVPPEMTRLAHEVYVVTTTLATFTAIDAGLPVICNGTAVGMISDRVHNPETVAVLIFSYYQDFIKYILAGGVAEIEESAVHVVVAIFESGKFLCGGFAVHNYYVVTVAHCVGGKDKANLLVSFSHVENPRMNPASEWSSVESIEVHPLSESSYNQDSEEYDSEYDIAVLKLKSHLPWNPMIRLKDIPEPRLISADRPCELLQWTDPSSGDAESKILTRSYVKIYERSRWDPFGPQQFRARGFYYLPIATDKDIGNPIIFENNIIGMVLNIGPDNIDYLTPVLCLKIRPHEAFIRKVIDEHNFIMNNFNYI